MIKKSFIFVWGILGVLLLFLVNGVDVFEETLVFLGITGFGILLCFRKKELTEERFLMDSCILKLGLCSLFLYNVQELLSV